MLLLLFTCNALRYDYYMSYLIHATPVHPSLCDNPQEQGITVAPLNVEVRYRSAGARRKSYLFPTTKVSQVLVDYALNKFKEQGG
jgi:hypothetical protein